MTIEQELAFVARSSAKLARKLGDFDGSADLIANMAAERTFEPARAILLANL